MLFYDSPYQFSKDVDEFLKITSHDYQATVGLFLMYDTMILFFIIDSTYSTIQFINSTRDYRSNFLRHNSGFDFIFISFCNPFG